jgi:hypothetical protein
MRDVAADVHALIQDLLPVVLPDARFDATAAEVILPVGWAEPHAVTTTIVGRCARAPRHTWPRLVDDWLRDVSDRATLAIGEIELLGDVPALLRLRIVPKLSGRAREVFVMTPFGPFFDAVVMIDHPRYGGPLTRDRAARLHLTDMGTHAIDNTEQHELAGLTVSARPLTATESVLVVTKPGCRYVSAALTDLARYLPRECPYGALVGVPDHNRLLLYPVASTAVFEVLPIFADVVAEMHDDGVDRCGRDIFWWADCHLFAIGAEGVSARGGSARRALPRKLRRLLRRLPSPTGG